MAGMYRMNDLLELCLREGAEELLLRVGKAPVMTRRAKSMTLDVPAITTDNLTELFQSITTDNQLKELRACGDVHFIYEFKNLGRFAVTATMQREAFDVTFKNLSQSD